MANITATFGSLFNTISTTANAATSLVGAAGIGANMLAAYAADAQAQQQEDHVLAADERTSNALAKQACRRIERARGIAAMNLTALEQQMYVESIAKGEALLKASKA
jgi:hypothetical protein